MNKRKIYCPVCGKFLCEVDDTTQGNVYLWCKSCKKEVKVTIK